MIRAWLGDIIGGLAIFALPFVLNFLGYGLGLN
jgi:hypothetical protein